MYIIGLSSVNCSACQLCVCVQWYENSNISDPELCHRCKLTLSSQQTMATSSREVKVVWLHGTTVIAPFCSRVW